MKVVLVGPGEVDGRNAPVWDAVRDVLHQLGPDDTVIHTGGNGVGMMVESIARRAKGYEKRNMPRRTLQLPEIVKYQRAEAFEKNAIQLVAHHRPDVVVYVGYGEDAETRAVRELALRERPDGTRIYPKITVQTHEEFIAERSAR